MLARYVQSAVCVLALALAAPRTALAEEGPRADAGAAEPLPSAPEQPAPQLDEPPGYRHAIEQALEELRRGHASEARALFVQAHQILPNARTLRGLGLAEFEMRRYVECIEHFELSLKNLVRPLDAALRIEVEQLLERARRFVTQLELTVAPRGATVSLDGSVLRGDPAKVLLLSSGEHTLEFEAAGHRPQRRLLHALGGDVQRIDVLLLPLPAAHAGTLDDERRAHKRKVWWWASAGAVLAGGAAAAAAVLATRHDEPNAGAVYRGTSGVSIEGP